MTEFSEPVQPDGDGPEDPKYATINGKTYLQRMTEEWAEEDRLNKLQREQKTKGQRIDEGINILLSPEPWQNTGEDLIAEDPFDLGGMNMPPVTQLPPFEGGPDIPDIPPVPAPVPPYVPLQEQTQSEPPLDNLEDQYVIYHGRVRSAEPGRGQMIIAVSFLAAAMVVVGGWVVLNLSPKASRSEPIPLKEALAASSPTPEPLNIEKSPTKRSKKNKTPIPQTTPRPTKTQRPTYTATLEAPVAANELQQKVLSDPGHIIAEDPEYREATLTVGNTSVPFSRCPGLAALLSGNNLANKNNTLTAAEALSIWNNNNIDYISESCDVKALDALAALGTTPSQVWERKGFGIGDQESSQALTSMAQELGTGGGQALVVLKGGYAGSYYVFTKYDGKYLSGFNSSNGMPVKVVKDQFTGGLYGMYLLTGPKAETDKGQDLYPSVLANTLSAWQM